MITMEHEQAEKEMEARAKLNYLDLGHNSEPVEPSTDEVYKLAKLIDPPGLETIH